MFSYPRLSRLNLRNGRSYFLFCTGFRAAGFALARALRFLVDAGGGRSGLVLARVAALAWAAAVFDSAAELR